MRVTVNVRRYFFLLFACIIVLPMAHADVCDPKAFHGPYGLSMTGATTIGGVTRPVAGVGRLVADGSGKLSGVSSASFIGLIFGNLVTGKYEAHWDCSVTWVLQDGYGSFQHFAGTMSPDGGRVAFRQTDPGGPEDGVLSRSMDGCSASSLAGTFHLTASGRAVDVTTAVDSGPISLRSVLIADGAGKLSLPPAPDELALTVGSYEVQNDCFVKLVLALPAGENKTPTMHFRAIVVDNGREVLGIQVDPGTVVAIRLISNIPASGGFPFGTAANTGTVTPLGEHRGLPSPSWMPIQTQCCLATPRSWSCMSSSQRRASTSVPANEAALESASDPNPEVWRVPRRNVVLACPDAQTGFCSMWQ